jgi:pimeloyl-ACP methyl ester carboxylesterase
VGGRLEVFEGCAHLPNLEQPDLFTELLLEFLEGVTPR